MLDIVKMDLPSPVNLNRCRIFDQKTSSGPKKTNVSSSVVVLLKTCQFGTGDVLDAT